MGGGLGPTLEEDDSDRRLRGKVLLSAAHGFDSGCVCAIDALVSFHPSECRRLGTLLPPASRVLLCPKVGRGAKNEPPTDGEPS